MITRFPCFSSGNVLLNHAPFPTIKLAHISSRQLPSLISLEVLHLRGTYRGSLSGGLPSNLESLSLLREVDLSRNNLVKIPEGLFSVPSLRRLNLSENELKDLPGSIDVWARLEVLNLARNQLTALPASLCKLIHLRRLILNGNELDFEGIPSGVGKLAFLQVFSAADNNLEMVPEGLCRWGQQWGDDCLGEVRSGQKRSNFVVLTDAVP